MNDYLDNHFHEVFLRNDVLAADDLLEDAGEDDALVHVEVDAVELAEAHEVGPDEDAQLAPFHLALLAVAGVALMLQAHPELVHLDEVGEDEGDGVLEVAFRAVHTTSQTRWKLG